MSVSEENIKIEMKPNSLNLSNLNVKEVEEYNNGRGTPASEPRAPSPLQSFFQKAKAATKKVSNVLKRSSTPLLSFKDVKNTYLYELYETYSVAPSAHLLDQIKQEVKHLGKGDPVVKTIRSYAEDAFENAGYVSEASQEKALVNALGGSTLSSGGRRRTRKRRSQKKRKLSKRK